MNLGYVFAKYVGYRKECTVDGKERMVFFFHCDIISLWG